jgi:hypothetical protein
MFLTAAALVTLVASKPISAQSVKDQADPMDRRTARVQTAPAGASSEARTNAAAASTINLRAIKDFKTRFANVKDEQWYTMEGGFITYFSNNGYPERVFYDRKGHWHASIIYADEHRLPADLRDLVRRAYYDQPITCVQILEVPQCTTYLVHVEDKSTLRILRVSEDGDIDVLQEFTKL